MRDIRKALVYQIINRVTGDNYIGSTKNKIATRWNYHLEKLRNGTHELNDWQKIWNESNICDWDFRILEDNIPIEKQFDKEEEWQDLIKPTLGSKSYFHKRKNEEKLEKVLKLLKEGKTYRDISKECDVSLGWITTMKNRYVCSVPGKVVFSE